MAYADGNIVIGTTVDMYGMNTGLKKIQTSVNRLSSTLSRVIGITAFVKLGKAALDAASDLQEVQNIVDVSFEDMTWKVEKFAETCIEKFGMSELSAKQTAGSFMAMGRAMDLTKEEASNMALKLTALTGDFASFYNLSQDRARVALSAVYTGETETLKRYGIILTQANLQEYANTLGIEKNVKAMSAREKLLLRYQYILKATQLVEGDFVRTQDTWANQVRVLKERWKQLLIVMGNGLITVLTPMLKRINQLISAMIKFANTVGRALSRIFGIKWQDMSAGASDMADSVGGATDALGDLGDAEEGVGKAAEKAGKKLHKQLQPFDELNNLTTNAADSADDLGSALGGIGDDLGADDYLGDLLDGGFEDGFKDWGINTLSKLGKWLNELLKDWLDSIDWDAIRKKARKIGEQIATFLNQLIDPELFYKIGNFLAQGLNTILELLDGFATKFSFKNLGASIAAGVNGFFENFDFDLFADTINHWVHGILDTIITFLRDVDWKLIGTRIMEFLQKIDWIGIGKKIITLIWEAIKAAAELYSAMFTQAPILTTILSLGGLVKFLTNAKFLKATKALELFFKTFSAGVAGTQATKALRGVSPLLSKVADGIDTVKISWMYAADAFNNGPGGLMSLKAGVGEFFNTFSSSLTTFQKALGGGIVGVAEFAIIENNFKNLVTLINSGSDAVEDFEKQIQKSVVAIGAALGVAMIAFSAIFGVPAGVIIAGCVAAVAAIAGLISAVNEIKFDNLQAALQTALMPEGGVSIVDVVNDVVGNIKDIGDSFDTVSEKSNVLDNAEKNIDDVVAEIDKMKDHLRLGVDDAEEAIPRLTELYGELATAIETKLGAAEDVVRAAFGEGGLIGEAFESTGIVAQDVIDRVTESFSEQEKQIYDYTNTINELSGKEYLTPEEERQLQAAQDGLMNMATEADAATQALDDLDYKTKGIDWSDIITDGEVDMAKLNTVLGELSTAVEETNATIDESMESTFKALKDNVNDPELIESLENSLPDALKYMHDQTTAEIEPTVSAIQDDLIGGINDVLEDAEKEWSEMSWFEKTFIWNNDFSSYASSAVSNYRDNYIAPIEEQLQGVYDELGLDLNTYATDAADEAIKQLFTSWTTQEGTTFKTLKEDWKTNGQDIIDGAIEGVKAKSGELADETGNAAKEALKRFHDDSGNGSPSTLYKQEAEWMVMGAIEGIIARAAEFATQLGTMATTALTTFGTNVLAGASQIVSDIFSFINDTFMPTLSVVMENIGIFIQNTITNIQNIITSIITFLSESFLTSWTTIWNNASDVFSQIWENIPNLLKLAVNTIISYINALIDGIGSGLNFLVDSLNNLKLDIPEWVPEIGGNSISFNLSKLSMPHIPLLAKGAVIPPNAPFMAMLGDQRNGTNVEAPLDTIKQALVEALQGYNGGNNGDIVINIDGREVFRVVRNQDDEYKRRNGGVSAFG